MYLHFNPNTHLDLLADDQPLALLYNLETPTPWLPLPPSIACAELATQLLVSCLYFFP